MDNKVSIWLAVGAVIATSVTLSNPGLIENAVRGLIDPPKKKTARLPAKQKRLTPAEIEQKLKLIQQQINLISDRYKRAGVFTDSDYSTIEYLKKVESQLIGQLLKLKK